MGVGKTIESLAVISCGYEKEWPVLIIAPSMLKYHWKNEIVSHL